MKYQFDRGQRMAEEIERLFWERLGPELFDSFPNWGIKWRDREMDNSRYKYRAWDIENKEMVPVDEIAFSLDGEIKGIKWVVSEIEKRTILKENLILMQFTGLQDSTTWEELTEDEKSKWTRKGNMPSEWKGKPIYEGDVVIKPNTYPFFEDGVKNYIGVVEWIFASWQYVLRCVNPNKAGISDGINEMLDGDGEGGRLFKIIGNIYENGELLEKS